jgi:hypothetical protein
LAPYLKLMGQPTCKEEAETNRQKRKAAGAGGENWLRRMWDWVFPQGESDQPARSPVNLLKMVVAKESPRLAGTLASVEANIRMMFGVFVAGLVALVGLWCEGAWKGHRLPIVVIVSGLLVILHTFTQTRYSELSRLLMALHLCAQRKDKESAVKALLPPPKG